MEAALEDDDVALAGRLPRQLDRPFDRFGAAVGEEETVDGRRRDPLQRLGQRRRLRRNDDVHLAKNDLPRLFLDGLHHPRVAVAGVGHANAGREVSVAPPVGVVEVDTLPAHRLDRGQMGPDG